MHPWLTCFNLRQHQRVRLHMSQTTDYVYDTLIRDKLVLDPQSRMLIEMLLHQREQHKDIIAKKGGGAVILCAGPPGVGKCLGKGTPVMLDSGEIRPVEAIRIGDDVMGPDSMPRRVLSITSGHAEMFRIVPTKGAPWICNDVHMLTLVHSVTGVVSDIALDEYLQLPSSRRHHLKLFQPEVVDFNVSVADGPEDSDVSPYFVGIWLGDGTKNLRSIGVSKPDAEIAAACLAEANKFRLTVRTSISPNGGCPTYHLHSRDGNKCNPLLNAMRGLMRDGIRIPWEFKYGSRDQRREVLAGILDTDGHLVHGGYEIAQKSKLIAEDIAFVARSLGLRVTEAVKTVNGKPYQRLQISGDCSKLPLRITRKRAGPRLQKKDALRTGFKVEPIGRGEYFGFTLDGDGRFLLGDFTVTHNTLTSEVFAESEKRPLYSVQCSQLGTSAGQLEESLLKIFARAARWKAILLLDEADVYIAKRGSDMNQNAIVGVFLRVLEYYNGVMFMTTNRAESVDDAVLSRCVARIDYLNPDPKEQVRIWHILAATSGLTLKAGAAEEIANKYSLSGRDVKQLLKLAGLVAYARKMTEINVAVIVFCMRFKPTERITPETKA